MKYIESDRYLAASWSEKSRKLYNVHVSITAKDYEGILNSVLTAVYESNVIFTAVNAQILGADKFEMTILLRVKNKEELDQFMKFIKSQCPQIDFIARKNIG